MIEMCLLSKWVSKYYESKVNSAIISNGKHSTFLMCVI